MYLQKILSTNAELLVNSGRARSTARRKLSRTPRRRLNARHCFTPQRRKIYRVGQRRHCRPPPQEVPPPRSSRFESSLVLSRVEWVRPELVAEVKYLTWTGNNLLRQVVYQSLCEDKPAPETRRGNNLGH